MTYNSLVAAKTAAGSIKRWFNTEELDVDQVLEEAQALIYQMLRVREMRSAASLNTITGDQSVALPADFLDPIGLTDSTNNVTLNLETESVLQQSYMTVGGINTSGTPDRYGIYNENISFNVRYAAAAALFLIYYKRPVLLGSSNQTNFLTTRYPHLVRAACRVLAQDFKRNTEEYKRAQEQLSALINRANAESDLVTRGSVLVIGPVRISLGPDRSNYVGVNTAQILKEAQLLIYQSLRVREMRASASLNTITGDQSVALPADFLDPIGLTDSTNNVTLNLETESVLQQSYMTVGGINTSGTPDRYGIYNENISFNVRYAAAAALFLIYYKRPALLTSSGQTNFLTERYLHLLRAACEVQLASFRQDKPAFDTASQQLAAAITQANAESDLATRGSVLVIGPVRVALGSDRANYQGISTAQILKEAQLLIYQSLRVREMRGAALLSMGVGDYFVAVPSDFLDPIGLSDTTNNVQLSLEPEAIFQQSQAFSGGNLSSGIPDRYGIYSEAITFNLKYAAGASLGLIYYKRPVLLTSSGQTNFLTERYLHLLRAACEVQLASFRQDKPAFDTASQQLAAAITQANAESDLATRGSVLVIGPVRVALGSDRANYQGISTAQILKEAQLLIYQSLRVREMRGAASLSMGSGDSTKALPDGFLDPISLKDTTNLINLKLRTERWINEARSYDDEILTSGIPCYCAIYGEAFQFDQAYDDAATLSLLYYKRPALLTMADTAGNFLTTRYLHLLRAACEAQVATFVKDEAGAQAALTQLALLIERANVEADLSYRGTDFDTEA